MIDRLLGAKPLLKPMEAYGRVDALENQGEVWNKTQ